MLFCATKGILAIFTMQHLETSFGLVNECEKTCPSIFGTLLQNSAIIQQTFCHASTMELLAKRTNANSAQAGERII